MVDELTFGLYLIKKILRFYENRMQILKLYIENVLKRKKGAKTSPFLI